MRKQTLYILALLIFISGCKTLNDSQDNTVLTMNINQIKIHITDKEQTAYLGLESSTKTFSFQDINTDIIIIDLFSMYCSYCQKNALHVNELFYKIKNSNMANSIKFIGLGFGNSEFEVNVFKKKYNIPFPLFPDPEYKISDKLNIDIVPHFAVLKRNEEGKFIMTYLTQGNTTMLEQYIFEQLNL